jgi:hypothetical protein
MDIAGVKLRMLRSRSASTIPNIAHHRRTIDRLT